MEVEAPMPPPVVEPPPGFVHDAVVPQAVPSKPNLITADAQEQLFSSTANLLQVPLLKSQLRIQPLHLIQLRLPIQSKVCSTFRPQGDLLRLSQLKCLPLLHQFHRRHLNKSSSARLAPKRRLLVWNSNSQRFKPVCCKCSRQLKQGRLKRDASPMSGKQRSSNNS